MHPLIRTRHALIAAAVLLAAAGSVWAQSDPPERVARLNYISGQVSFRPASLEDWGAATINYPLTTGDHLWTEQSASAELHVGSSVIRLAPETAFAFLNLDNDVVQARVAEGTLDLRVREIYEGEAYEIDTPNAAISILRPGIYHIDVDPQGDRTRVTVRAGEVEVDGNGRTFSVNAGQMAEIIGVEDVAYDLGRAPSPDRWELWCRDRDSREDNRLALNYVSRDMVGYEDLDDYGTWSYVPEYGYGWQPTVVAVDWAPYRYGRWSWVRPWGWTWIDDARWGFAPSHYGRWTCYRDRWIWLPGHRSPRPVWAPALVAFVGGRNWNFSFGIGVRPAVAWFPLGPGEFYCPSYRASARYLRNLNVRNVNITNFNVTNFNVTNVHYSNRGVAGAMTAVPREMFVASQSVHRVGVAVPRYTAEQTPVVGHAVAVTPDATSVIGRVAANAPRPPSSVMRRAVVARTEPPAAGTQAAPVVRLSRRPTSDTDRARLAGSNGPVATQAPATSESGATARPRSEQATPDSPWRPATGRTPQPSQQMAWPQAPQGDRTTAGTSWRPSPGRTEQSTPQPEAPRTTQSERAVPRSETPRYQAPSYQTPRTQAPPSYQAPSYQAPRYQPEAPRIQATPRDERPAQNSERVAPREERPAPSREVRETPAPERSARPRSEERSQDRPAAPARVDRPAAAPPQSARPAERAAERPQPKSGGQSDQSAKPRGGRGGDR